MDEIKLGNKIIGEGDIYFIAEMSANHNMDKDRAKRIVYAAKEAGADAIKLQTYTPDTITLNVDSEEFRTTDGSLWSGMKLYELYKKAYTPWEWHSELMDYANSLDIDCFSSPFDLTSVDFLRQFDMPAYKIASYEITDIPLIDKVARERKPVIISTGIANISDIDLAVDTCFKAGNRQVILLKCVSEYPTPYDELNLKTITNMAETFNVNVGISDHSMGTHVPVAAVALGATVIEKHITLSRDDGGVDSAFSLEPAEFSKMVSDVKDVKKALGCVTYELTSKQKKEKEHARSLYVAEDIKKGEVFTSDNLKSVRPGYGLHTKHYYDILGKTATSNLKKGTAMSWEYVKGNN